MGITDKPDHFQRPLTEPEKVPLAFLGSLVGTSIAAFGNLLGSVFGTIVGAAAALVGEKQQTLPPPRVSKGPKKQRGSGIVGGFLGTGVHGVVAAVGTSAAGECLEENDPPGMAGEQEAVKRREDNNNVKEDSVAEEKQPKEKQPKVVWLKNGTQIEADRGWECLSCLQVLAEDEPEWFKILLAIARGNPTDVNADHIEPFVERGFFTKAGAIDPDMKNVLLSGYQETREGLVMTNAFKPADVTEARALETDEEEWHQKFLPGLWKKYRDSEEGKDRSR